MYVTRNANGQIIGVYALQQPGATEFVAITSAELIAFLNPVIPDPQGFIQAAKAIFGGPVAILNYPVSLQNAIMYCLQAVEQGQWQDAHDIIAAFQTQIALANATAYPKLKAAVATYNLPIPALP